MARLPKMLGLSGTVFATPLAAAQPASAIAYHAIEGLIDGVNDLSGSLRIRIESRDSPLARWLQKKSRLRLARE